MEFKNINWDSPKEVAVAFQRWCVACGMDGKLRWHTNLFGDDFGKCVFEGTAWTAEDLFDLFVSLKKWQQSDRPTEDIRTGEQFVKDYIESLNK